MGLGLDRVRHDPKRSGNPNFEINLYKNPEKVSCPFAYAERNWVSEITTFLFDSSMATARTVKDVSPHDFVKAYASHLKRSGKVQFLPSLSSFSLSGSLEFPLFLRFSMLLFIWVVCVAVRFVFVLCLGCTRFELVVMIVISFCLGLCLWWEENRSY